MNLNKEQIKTIRNSLEALSTEIKILADAVFGVEEAPAICLQCKHLFTYNKRKIKTPRLYCSQACRSKAWRDRKREIPSQAQAAENH